MGTTGGVAIGAVFARLGIQTDEFHTGLAKAGTGLTSLKNKAQEAASTMHQSLGPSFGTAAMMASTFSGQLKDAALGFARVTGASPAMSAALTTLSSSTMLAAGAYGRLSMGVKDFAKASPDAAMAMGNMALASAQMGKSLGTVLTDTFPQLTQAFSYMRNSTSGFGEAMAKNKELFQRNLALLPKLTAQLGLNGEAWKVNSEFTRENAHRLAQLIDQAMLMRKSLAALGQATTEARIALSKLGTDSAAALTGAAKGAASLREQFGVLTGPQVVVAMAKLSGEFRELVEQGVSARQLLGAFSGKVSELTRVAGDYKGLNMPKEFADLAAAMGDGGSVGAVERLTKAMQTELPAAVNAATAASKVYLDELGERLKGSLSGGFGRGVEDGTNAGKQALDQFQRDTEGKQWKIHFDVEHMQRQIGDAISGAMARTGGRV